MKKIFSAIAISLCVMTSSYGTEIQMLLQDTQKMTQSGQITNMVWWIPSQFWEASLQDNPQLSQEQKEEFIAVLDEYSAFVIVNMKVGPLGGMNFQSRGEILRNTTLTVNKTEIKPIKRRCQNLLYDDEAIDGGYARTIWRRHGIHCLSKQEKRGKGHRSTD